MQIPHVTRLVWGSSTYTPPAGATVLWVRAVGGGGGGCGNGADGVTWNYGEKGTDSVFGNLIAIGGNGGGVIGDQGAGGSYSPNCDGPRGFGLLGGNGSAMWLNANAGGQGGVNPFGGLAGSGYLDDGIPGCNQTGAGGAGAGASGTSPGGSGGGAGGYFEQWFPAQQYPYSVGRGGVGGPAGLGGYKGGDGGHGQIVITAFF